MHDDRDQSEIKAPQQKRRVRNDVQLASSAYRRVVHLLRASNRKGPAAASPSRGRAKGRGLPSSLPMHHLQRASIRMTYARNHRDGQWGAHGRYISRDSANPEAEAGFGFDKAADNVPIPETLSRWQRQGDAVLFKFILSPEFGERMDLRQCSRDLVQSLEKDLGVTLEWVGLDHYNTEHPHVHLAVRGVDGLGGPLRIDPTYIKTALRLRARQAATNQIGLRTEQDITDAWTRQVGQQRFTELDRMILRRSRPDADGNQLVELGARLPAAVRAREARLQQIRRLVHLERMGLAKRMAPTKWIVSHSLQTVLRERQSAMDRLKLLHRNRELLSDERLPIQQTDMRSVGRIAGRLMGTGIEEASERPFMLIEALEGVVHYLYQSPAFMKARSNGIKTGDFIELIPDRLVADDGAERVRVRIRSYGNAQSLLTSNRFLDHETQRVIESSGALPVEQSFGGWLGSFQRALSANAQEQLLQGIIKLGADGKYRLAHPRRLGRVDSMRKRPDMGSRLSR